MTLFKKALRGWDESDLSPIMERRPFVEEMRR